MSTRAATALVHRRHAVLTARHRRRRTVLLATVAGAAAVTGVWWVGTGPMLRISSVEIAGYRQADQADLARVVQIAAREGTMLRLPTVAVREALVARFPWVADVTLHHNWPRGVDVVITQAAATAIAIAPDGTRLAVSDAGRVLGPAGETQDGLPQFRAPGLAIGAWLRGPAQRAPFEFLAAMSPGVAQRMRDVRLQGGLVLGRLAGGPEVRGGPPAHMWAKGRAVEAVVTAPRLAAHLATATSLDVSAPKQPTLGGVDVVVGGAPEASTQSSDSGSDEPQP